MRQNLPLVDALEAEAAFQSGKHWRALDGIARCLAGGETLDIEGALRAKMIYNEGRPYRHGGKLA